MAEQEVQAAINAARHLPAQRPADPADLQQDQSGRRAHPDAGADLRQHAAAAGRGPGRHRPSRRRSRSCRASAWSASAAARSRRCAFRPIPTALASYGMSLEELRTVIAPGQRRPGQGTADGPAAGLHHRRQRSAAVERKDYADTIVAYKNGDPVRLSDVASVIDGAGEREPGRLDEQHAGGHPQHPAAARRQHHQGRRQHQAAAAAAAGEPARRRSRSRC